MSRHSERLDRAATGGVEHELRALLAESEQLGAQLRDMADLLTRFTDDLAAAHGGGAGDG